MLYEVTLIGNMLLLSRERIITAEKSRELKSREIIIKY